MPASRVLWSPPLIRLPPWFPGQMGVPGTDSDQGLRLDTLGNVFYVDPNYPGANDRRDGTNPKDPLATVGAALLRVRPYSGDVIAVMGNSLWTYGTITVGRPLPIQENVIVTVPGVRIVGLMQSGSLGVPWIPPLQNTACITVRALDTLLEGFNFWNAGNLVGTTGILAQWDAPNVYGENLTVQNCFFFRLAYGLQLDYTYNCHILGNRFESQTIQAIHNPSVFGEPHYAEIINNVFVENAGGINLPDCDWELIEENRFIDNTVAMALAAGTRNTIHKNTIQGDPAGANNFINLTGGADNLVSENDLACTVAQYDTTCSDATSGSWVFNHCTNGSPVAPPT